MKRLTVRLIVAVLTFTIGIVAVLLWMVSPSQPPNKFQSQQSNEIVLPLTPNPAVESIASPHQEEPTYDEVATYIANRVLALKGKVAGFGSIRRAKNVRVKENPFEPVVDYSHGVLRYKPVPDSEPPMKEAVYAKDGFTVVIWMVRGEITWETEKPPVEIGPYKIDAGVAGPQQSRAEPIIDRIVSEAADYFNRKAQSNNGMHPTANTTTLNFGNGPARRVMPGVMRLHLRAKEKHDESNTSHDNGGTAIGEPSYYVHCG